MDNMNYPFLPFMYNNYVPCSDDDNGFYSDNNLNYPYQALLFPFGFGYDFPLMNFPNNNNSSNWANFSALPTFEQFQQYPTTSQNITNNDEDEDGESFKEEEADAEPEKDPLARPALQSIEYNPSQPLLTALNVSTHHPTINHKKPRASYTFPVNDKRTIEEKASELRARLLAMKAALPHKELAPAVISNPNTTSQRQSITSNPNPNDTQPKSTFAADVDRLVEQGRAAATASNYARSSGTGTSDRPQASTNSIKPGNKDSRTRASSQENGELADYSPPKHISSDVLSDHEEYRKLQKVAERFKGGKLVNFGSFIPANGQANSTFPYNSTSERLDRPNGKDGATTTLNEHSGVVISSRTQIYQEEQDHSLLAQPKSALVERLRDKEENLDFGRDEDEEPLPHNNKEEIEAQHPSQDPHQYYEDLEDWLELTGYHDGEYRERTLDRHRKAKILKAQLAQLEEEAHLEGSYTFRASNQALPAVDVKPVVPATMAPPPLPFPRVNRSQSATAGTPDNTSAINTQLAQNTMTPKRPMSPSSTDTPRPTKSAKKDNTRDPRLHPDRSSDYHDPTAHKPAIPSPKRPKPATQANSLPLERRISAANNVSSRIGVHPRYYGYGDDHTSSELRSSGMYDGYRQRGQLSNRKVDFRGARHGQRTSR